MPAIPRQIASPASRHILAASFGGVIPVVIAQFAHNNTTAPDANGKSPGRIDRTEARRLTTGAYAPTTLVPLFSALICIGLLYTKGRAVLGEAKGPLDKTLAAAAAKAGAKMLVGEGPKTKVLYATAGGAIFGSMAADPIVYGGDSDY